MKTLLRWSVFGLGSSLLALYLYWTLIAPDAIARMVEVGR